MAVAAAALCAAGIVYYIPCGKSIKKENKKVVDLPLPSMYNPPMNKRKRIKRITIKVYKKVCVECLTMWQTGNNDAKVCHTCIEKPSTILARRLANIISL